MTEAPSQTNTNVSEVDPQNISIPARVDQFKRIHHNLDDSPYPLPADIEEGHRLNLQHHLVNALFQSNYMVKSLESQLQAGIKVLDVGTGTGYWPFEMQREFPNSEFHGVDIALGKWTDVAKAHGNVTFTFGNVLGKLPYEDNTFDYVHQRFLVAGVPTDKWTHVIQEIKRVTKPGGWIELVEADIIALDAGPKVTAFHKSCRNAFESRGVDFSIAYKLLPLLKSVDLDNISGNYGSAPIGWNGVIGSLALKDFVDGSMSAKGFLAPYLNLNEEDFEALVKETYAEPQTSAYMNFYWGIGQKKSE